MSKDKVKDINEARAKVISNDLEQFIRNHNRSVVTSDNPLKISSNQRTFEHLEKSDRETDES